MYICQVMADGGPLLFCVCGGHQIPSTCGEQYLYNIATEKSVCRNFLSFDA
jgi:hypothetical protein